MRQTQQTNRLLSIGLFACLCIWIVWVLPLSSTAGSQVGKSGKQGARAGKALSSDKAKKPVRHTPGRAATVEQQHQPRRIVLSELERIHPGLLQMQERAIPRLDRNLDGQVDGWEREIAQDRFLQLDRNRDGIVDPMERALDPIDMDRYGRTGSIQQAMKPVPIPPKSNAEKNSQEPEQKKSASSRPGSKAQVHHIERATPRGTTPSVSSRRQARVTPRTGPSSR